MNTIHVTPQEVESRVLSDAHREAAVQVILQDGYVILDGVVSTTHLETLRERMLSDVKAIVERDDAPFNWNVGNVQQDPPPFAPYLFADVLMNDLVVQVTQAVLGRGVKNSMYSGNTAMPSDQRQPVHADMAHLWPRLEVAHPPVHLVVNVPVVDMSAENGSTEIWPGTHHDVTITSGKDIKIPAEQLERRRADVPPIQPTVRLGGVLIRDMRLWHAGMPNRTDRPRPMIAMVHSPSWIDVGTPLTFPKASEEFFQHPLLRTCARFVDGPIDHINAPQGHEYEK